MRNIVRALKLVMPIAPVRMLVYFLLSLPGAILPSVMLFLQHGIVDEATNLNRNLSLFYYIKPVLMLIGTYMVMKLFALAANQYMEFGYFRYVFMGLDRKIHEKSALLPLEYYENAQYYQSVQKAKNASMFLVFTANLAIMSVVLICNLLSVSGYLVTLHPLLIIFVVLVSMPVVLEKIQGAKHQSDLVQNTVQAARRKKYAFGLLSAYDSKKEISHHGVGGRLAEKYLAACEETYEKETKHVHYVWRNGMIFAGVKSLFHCGAILLMVWLLNTDRITVGGFSVLLTSFSVLTGAFTRLFGHAGEILRTGIMSASFFELMDIDIKDGDKPMEVSDEFVRLNKVSYQYPNGKTTALKNITLSIRKGERIAIVGANGAGKTTLAKMLSGFLVPTEGTLEMCGVVREQLKESSIYEQISAVYQEFGRYKLTLAQNVYLGDTDNPADMDRIRDALHWAGVLDSKEPEKVLLGKEFGGRELSGGQWQRLALARSYYRQRPILFFDEPTAAIDPLEEMSIYERLDQLARGRTVVLVTHRLGAVRGADKIIVMEKGSIVEMGSFSELLEQKGSFYYIWKEQTKWYQKE